ncbi:MAG TPA: hypothetical protein DEP35_15400 [Deltaproteobacteria bacterium]|nr:hypothetical protein [Deltaproteobacteria bacterium]
MSPVQRVRAVGLGESTVRRWIDQGRVLAVKTPGGHRRFPIALALRFVRGAGLSLLDPAALDLFVGGRVTPRLRLRHAGRGARGRLDRTRDGFRRVPAGAR